jgi:hypothetical protein
MQFEQVIESIEEQTALFPLLLESDSAHQIYMLPRRFLNEEVSAFNAIYTSVSSVEPNRVVKHADFIKGNQ